jgi:hypothetical protein
MMNNVTVIPGEFEFRAYWIATGRPFREMENAWADWRAGWETAACRPNMSAADELNEKGTVGA